MKPFRNNTGKSQEIFTFGNPTDTFFEMTVATTLVGRLIGYQYNHMVATGKNIPEQFAEPGDIWTVTLEGGYTATANYDIFPNLLDGQGIGMIGVVVILKGHMTTTGLVLDPLEEQAWVKEWYS